MFLLTTNCFSQVLIVEDCFTGGVQTGGHATLGSFFGGTYDIKWEDDYTLRSAYAICYRYGNIAPHIIYLNDSPVRWSNENQAAPEQFESNPDSNPFAVHCIDITELISITNDEVSVDFPDQNFYSNAWNWGWWGVYVVIFYESPTITSNVCGRIYLANQTQTIAQNYVFETPSIQANSPALFSIFSNRLSDFFIDATRISLNGISIGDVWSHDPLLPGPGSGVQGHYWYQDAQAQGLNGDTANNSVFRNDGIAIINEYLEMSQPSQSLRIERIVPNSVSGFNPHPAFTLAYTPTCTPPVATMPRSLSFCRMETSEETRQLQAIAGYDHYNWSPGQLVSDSTLANPICLADSSGWFRVRMWNDDETGICSQTIPVFVTVGQVPRPSRLFTRSSPCPNPTGRIAFEGMAGTPPFQFTVGGVSQSDTLFTGLAAGTYPVSVVDALGCTWDSVAVIPLNPLQEAAFTANPSQGFTPLRVAFTNESSTISTGYQWLIDGEPISKATDFNYTFADSGTYQVALVAYYLNETCTDTAFVTIRVNQGLELIIPNIISPNGDGRNDALVAQIAGVAELRWQIFNRWGQEVHASSQNGLDTEERVLLWQPTDISAGVYSLIIQAVGTSAPLGDPGSGQVAPDSYRGEVMITVVN